MIEKELKWTVAEYLKQSLDGKAKEQPSSFQTPSSVDMCSSLGWMMPDIRV